MQREEEAEEGGGFIEEHIRDRGKVEGATAMESKTLGALEWNDEPVSWEDKSLDGSRRGDGGGMRVSLCMVEGGWPT